MIHMKFQRYVELSSNKDTSALITNTTNLNRSVVKVLVKVTSTVDDVPHDNGVMIFPDKNSWTMFIGTMQKGDIYVKNFSVSIENVTDEDAQKLFPSYLYKPIGGSTNANPK